MDTRHRWREDGFLTRVVFEQFLNEKQLCALDQHINDLATRLRRSEPGQGSSTLGDHVLAEPEQALRTIHEGTNDARTWLARSLGRTGNSRTGAFLRAEYGIQSGHSLPNARLLICLTADAWFDAYASGFWSVTRASRTDPRVDVRSACNLIWSWGNVEHCALATALSLALRHPDTAVVAPFPPFRLLFKRVLGMHPSVGGSPDDRAGFLSSFAVERLTALGPGRITETQLFAPLMEALRFYDDKPGVRLELGDAPESYRQRLADAALPLFQDLRRGVRGDAEPALLLQQLRQALTLATRDGHD